MNERGNISFVLIFFFLFIVVTFMFIVLAPALQNYTSRIYTAAEPLIDDSNTVSNSMGDPQVQSIFRDSLTSQKDSFALQLEILGALTTYGWLIVVLMVMLIFLLFSRFLVERSTQGGIV